MSLLSKIVCIVRSTYVRQLIANQEVCLKGVVCTVHEEDVCCAQVQCSVVTVTTAVSCDWSTHNYRIVDPVSIC